MEHVSIHDDEAGQPEGHQSNQSIVPHWIVIPLLPGQVQEVHLTRRPGWIEEEEGVVAEPAEESWRVVRGDEGDGVVGIADEIGKAP